MHKKEGAQGHRKPKSQSKNFSVKIFWGNVWRNVLGHLLPEYIGHELTNGFETFSDLYMSFRFCLNLGICWLN